MKPPVELEALFSLLQYGAMGAIIVVGIVGVWKGLREVWSSVRSWVDILVKQFIRSAQARDDFYGRQEAADERRHAMTLAHVTDGFTQSRHDTANKLQVVIGSIGETIHSEHKLTRAVVTGTVSEDIPEGT